MAVALRRIIAHHLLFPLYGHWAPNDPRGSGSAELFNDELEALGPIHFGRKPQHLQPSREELRAFHRAFKAKLKHRPFWIDQHTRALIATAFQNVIDRRGYTVYACAICSNHAHAVVRVHRDDALAMWDAFAEESRTLLRSCGEIEADHPVWADRPYKVFLNSIQQVRTCIGYVQQNPVKEGLAPQAWPFVKVYDGWPLHKAKR